MPVFAIVTGDSVCHRLTDTHQVRSIFFPNPNSPRVTEMAIANSYRNPGAAHTPIDDAEWSTEPRPKGVEAALPPLFDRYFNGGHRKMGQNRKGFRAKKRPACYFVRYFPVKSWAQVAIY